MSPKNKSAKKLFLNTIDTRSSGLLNSIAKTKIESNRFVHSTEHLVHNIEFYSDSVKKSKKLHEYRFTNFLHDTKTHPQIKQRIYELIQDPTVIDNQHVGEVRINDKIRRCLELYVDDLQEELFIFKSDIRDSFGGQVGVRVYIFFELPNDNPDMQLVFKIALIDPFHLVIPSMHQNYNKEKMERHTYNNNEANSLCISEWLQDQLL